MERRFDPVTGEWRMFAGHRQDRTFLPPAEFCPLCPTREGHPPTEIPLPAFDVAVFENRFPALVRRPPPPAVAGSALSPVAPSAGANEVVVYSDDHQLGLADMDVARIARVIEVWTDRYAELGARDEVDYVFVFENRGVAVGVTLHHPHGQIYAYPEIPPRMRQVLAAAEAHGGCVYCDVVAEDAAGPRVVARSAGFLAFVPFAARFPYEVHLAPARHAPSLLDLDGAGHEPVSHLHLEFTPLHRTADKLKYLAGSELGAGAFINDVAPEDAAGRLREAVASGTPAPPGRP